MGEVLGSGQAGGRMCVRMTWEIETRRQQQQQQQNTLLYPKNYINSLGRKEKNNI